jgi:hypothetical protein
VNPELPPGYRVLRDADTLVLVAANAHDVAYFGVCADPRDVAIAAWAHDSRTNARIANLEHLLGRRLWHGSAS